MHCCSTTSASLRRLHDVSIPETAALPQLHTCTTSAYLRQLHLHYVIIAETVHLHYVIIAETAAPALRQRRLLLHLHDVSGYCYCICMTSAETAAAPALRQLHVFCTYITCIMTSAYLHCLPALSVLDIEPAI
jgi:hypothetical protein